MESDEFEDGATVLEAGGKMLLLMLLQWSMSAEEEDEGLDETGLEANETYVGMEVDEGLGLDGANNGLGVDEGLGWDETYEGLEVDEGLGSGDLEVDDTPISTSTALWARSLNNCLLIFVFFFEVLAVTEARTEDDDFAGRAEDFDFGNGAEDFDFPFRRLTWSLSSFIAMMARWRSCCFDMIIVTLIAFGI